jgi:hypothetical protein
MQKNNAEHIFIRMFLKMQIQGFAEKGIVNGGKQKGAHPTKLQIDGQPYLN